MTCLVIVSRVQAKGALKLLKHHINLRYKRKTDVRASLLVANFLSPFESQRLKTQTIEERIKKNKNNQTADEFHTSTPSPFISSKS
jgi:hypothetical protein